MNRIINMNNPDYVYSEKANAMIEAAIKEAFEEDEANEKAGE